jgi:hypothetical protein
MLAILATHGRWHAVVVELTIDADGVRLPATLDRPTGPLHGGLVALHGAQAGQRSFFLYEHRARMLPRVGVAVLRYDRRPGVDGADCCDHVPTVNERQDIDGISSDYTDTLLTWLNERLRRSRPPS